QLPSWMAGHSGGHASAMGAWSTKMLERSCDVLNATFPRSDDLKRPRGVAHSPPPQDELQTLRGRVPVVLAERGGVAEVAAIRRLGEKYPEIAKWWAHVNANRSALGVLSFVRPPGSVENEPPRAIPIHAVVTLL